MLTLYEATGYLLAIAMIADNVAIYYTYKRLPYLINRYYYLHKNAIAQIGIVKLMFAKIFLAAAAIDSLFNGGLRNPSTVFLTVIYLYFVAQLIFDIAKEKKESETAK